MKTLKEYLEDLNITNEPNADYNDKEITITCMAYTLSKRLLVEFYEDLLVFKINENEKMFESINNKLKNGIFYIDSTKDYYDEHHHLSFGIVCDDRDDNALEPKLAIVDQIYNEGGLLIMRPSVYDKYFKELEEEQKQLDLYKAKVEVMCAATQHIDYFGTTLNTFEFYLTDQNSEVFKNEIKEFFDKYKLNIKKEYLYNERRLIKAAKTANITTENIFDGIKQAFDSIGKNEPNIGRSAIHILEYETEKNILKRNKLAGESLDITLLFTIEKIKINNVIEL